MKQLLSLFIITISLLLTGCEKVINLDLKNAQPVIVIEANINDQSQVQTVKISKTYNFDEPNKFNFFSGASVVLTSSDGQKITFTENKPGIYESPRFRGRPGITYTININAGGKTYTAISTMPKKVNLIALSFRKYSFFDNERTYIVAHFDDPPGIQNQYRYVLKLNNVFQEDFVSEDRFDDGNKISNVLFSELKDLKINDVVEVELQAIDRNVFKYFYSIEQNTNQGPPVSPANPDSNFNNGALGVFNVYTSSKQQIMVR